VKELLPNLLDNGRVVRGWVGISAQEITEGGIRVPVVTDVFRGSPAQDGGVLTGDRVVLINGKPIERYQTLLRRIALQAPGTKLTLGLRRAGRPLEVRVTLASRPVETAIKAMVSGGRIDSLGLTLRELDVEEVRRAGLERSLRIEAISPGGPADLAGLSAGDLLLEVNRQPVGTLGEVSAAWGAKGSAVFVKVKRGDVARYVSLAPEPQ
jgi:serine protease Do